MLFRELGGCGATAGPAFFDGILEPYTKVWLACRACPPALASSSALLLARACTLPICPLARLHPQLHRQLPVACLPARSSIGLLVSLVDSRKLYLIVALLPSPLLQLYLDMMSEEWRPRSSTGSSGSGTSGSSSGSSQEQQALKEASYLLTCLRRLSAKLDDW